MIYDKKMLLNLLLIKYNIFMNVNITNLNLPFYLFKIQFYKFKLHSIYLKYNFTNL